jgi:hypothetical protein
MKKTQQTHALFFFHKNQSGKINYEIENGLDKIMKNKWGDQLE